MKLRQSENPIKQQIVPKYDVQILSSVREIEKTQLEWEHFLNQRAGKHIFRQAPNIIPYHLKLKSEPRVVILRKKGEIVCIAPFILSQQEKFVFNFSVFKINGPRSSTLKLLGNDFIFSKQADISACINCIFSTLPQSISFDLVSIEDLAKSSAIYTTFAKSNFELLNFKLFSTSPKIEKIRKHILQVTYDLWINSLRGKTRGKIRRKLRSLHKKFPEQVKFVTITKPDQVVNFLNNLDELYPKTWQAKTFGVHSRNTLQETEYYKYLTEKNWLRSYLLSIDNKPVAFLIGFQYAGTFHHSECGYDPEFSSAGVGSVLNYLMLENLYDTNKPSELDFGFGENEYKRIIGNFECDAFSTCLTVPGMWRRIIQLQRIISLAEEKLRSMIIHLKLDKAVRKILKRK